VDISSENTALNCSTDCNSLVRIHTLVGFLIEYLPYHLLHCRHSSLTPDKYNLIDLCGCKPCILQCVFTGYPRAFDKIGNHLLEFRSCKVVL